MHARLHPAACVRLLSALTLFFCASAARADWLVHLPDCAMRQASVRELGDAEVLYPAPGLPSFARPGDTIVIRVRLPAPLTPPPGIQQYRALDGWSASLIGTGTRHEEAEFRYRLRVRDVRADADSTRLYRATVRVPLFAAPGVYHLELEAPFARETLGTSASVIVGDEPSLETLDSPSETVSEDAIAWVTDPALAEALRRRARVDSLAFVDASHPGAVLRFGAQRVLGGCNDPFFPFSRFVDSEAEEFEISPLAATAQIEVGADEVRNVGTAPGHFRWVLAEGLIASEVPAGTRAYPATNVRPIGQVPSVVLLVPLAAGETFALRTETRASSELSLTGDKTIEADQSATLRSEQERTAWAWEEDGAAFGQEIEAAFLFSGARDVYALRVAENGAVSRGATHVVVRETRRTGCSASEADGASWFTFVMLICAWRRRR